MNEYHILEPKDEIKLLEQLNFDNNIINQAIEYSLPEQTSINVFSILTLNIRSIRKNHEDLKSLSRDFDKKIMY